MIQISAYSTSEAALWDELVGRCPMGIFLHTRRFLSYHGDRFRDASLIFKNEKEETVGLLPAAIDPDDERRVVSHPGITFGGLLHSGSLSGARMLEAFEGLTDYYRKRGFASLRYKAVPHIYHQRPSSDDLYALFKLNAVRSRCELSCAIELANRREPSERRKRGLKKALNRGVTVAEGAKYVEALWRVLEENLERKLGEKPVHTLEEIMQLRQLFPEEIRFLVALLNRKVVAGVVLFSSRQVTRAQYITSSEEGNEVAALDAVIEHAIDEAHSSGRKYFDFGTSNRDAGRHLSASVYDFKVEFGGGGAVQEVYDVDLNA